MAKVIMTRRLFALLMGRVTALRPFWVRTVRTPKLTVSMSTEAGTRAWLPTGRSAILRASWICLFLEEKIVSTMGPALKASQWKVIVLTCGGAVVVEVGDVRKKKKVD